VRQLHRDRQIQIGFGIQPIYERLVVRRVRAKKQVGVKKNEIFLHLVRAADRKEPLEECGKESHELVRAVAQHR